MFQMFSSLAIDMNPFRRDLRQARTEAQQTVDAIEKGAGASTGVFSRIGKAISTAFGGGKKDAQSFYSDVEKSNSKLKSSFEGMKGLVSNIFQGIGQGIGQGVFNLAAKGVDTFKGALFGLNNQMEAAQAKINAFTKDAGKTNDILAYLNKEAAITPFAFQDMADAAGALLPIAKTTGKSLEDLMKTAEILGASNPLQGLAGASFALREAMTGDFSSLIERFDLSRVKINQWKEEGVSNFEIIQRAMKDMGYDADLVSKMGETLSGRWSTFQDTLDALLRTITSPLFNVLKDWLKDVQGLLDANQPRLQAFAEVWGNRIARGAQLARDSVVTFWQAWQGGWQDSDRISSGFVRNVGRIASTINEMRGQWQSFMSGFSGGAGDALRPGDAWTAFGNSAYRVFDTIRDRATATFGFITDTIDKLTSRWDALNSKMHPTDMSMGNDKSQGKSGGFNVSGTEVGVAAGAAGVGLLGAAGAFGALAVAAAPIMPLLSPLIGVFSSLIGILPEVIVPLGLVAAAAGGLYIAWQTNFLGIRDITKSVMDSVSSTLMGAQPMWDGFVSTAKGKLDEWKANLQTTGDEFKSWTQGPIGQSLTDLQGVAAWTFGSMADSTRDLVSKLTPNLPQLQSSFETFGIMASSVLSPVITTIRDDLGPAMQTVVNWGNQNLPLLAAAWANVAKGAGIWIGWIIDRISDFTDMASRFINQHHDEIIRIITDTWVQVRSAVAVPLEIISGLIRTTLLLISGDWSGAWNEIKQTGMDVWNNIQTFYSAGFDIFKTIVGGAMDWVHGKITDKWNEIKTVFSSATEAVKTTVDNWSDGLKNKLNTWSDELGKKLLSPFEGLRDKVGGALSGVAGSISGALAPAMKVMDNFGSGVSKVLNWIGNALGKGDVAPWTPIGGLATGTQNWTGGWAWVGEGNGGSGAELAYLPAGAKVIPHDESMKMVGAGAVPMHSGDKQGDTMPGFAGGLGLLDIFKNGPEWLAQKAMDAVGLSAPQLPGALAGAGTAVFNKVKEWIGGWVAEFVKKALPVGADQVQAMINFAESQIGLPYIWGGGHGGGGGPGVGFDCSGFVAAVLDAGGIPNPHGIVTDFYNWMAKNGGNGVVDIGVWQPTNPDPTQQHVGIRLLGTDYESGGASGGVGRNGTRFPEYGTPPGLAKASAPGDLSSIDVETSLRNMRLGIKGQWSGVTAMAKGGVINELVNGIGATTGRPYLFGEDGPEAVIPISQNGGARGRGSSGPTQSTGTRNTDPTKDPSDPRYLGPAGTGTYDEELKFPPGDDLKPEWDDRRRILGVPTSTDVRNTRDRTQSTGSRGSSTSDWGPKTGPIGTTGPSTISSSDAANQQVQHAIATGDFIPIPGGLNEDDPSIVAALMEWQLRHVAETGDFVPKGTGLMEDDPQVTRALDQWRGKQGGSAPAASSTPGSGISATVDGMASAVRDGINASFLFTVFGGGKAATPPSDAPAGTAPGSSVNPTPVVTQEGGIRSRYYYGNGSGSLIPGRATETAGRAGAGMKGHFPEEVVPDPGHPGERWIGVVTNTIYAADGSVIEAGDYNNQRGPGPTTPSGTGGQPMGGGPAPVYPWGLDPNGRPSPTSPLDGIGRLGNNPGGLTDPITIRLVLDGSGADIVRLVSADADASEQLAAIGFQLLLDNAPKR